VWVQYEPRYLPYLPSQLLLSSVRPIQTGKTSRQRQVQLQRYRRTNLISVKLARRSLYKTDQSASRPPIDSTQLLSTIHGCCRDFFTIHSVYLICLLQSLLARNVLYRSAKSTEPRQSNLLCSSFTSPQKPFDSLLLRVRELDRAPILTQSTELGLGRELCRGFT
jgi:hypothetical protein